MVRRARRSLVVNAAFLQEIKDSNPELWSTARAVRQSAQASYQSRAEVCRMVRQLAELRDLMALQFSLEEAYGFMECADDLGGDFRDRVEAALDQHRQLYLTVSELSETAEDLEYRGADFRLMQDLLAQTLAFDLQWTRHERLESELMLATQLECKRH